MSSRQIDGHSELVSVAITAQHIVVLGVQSESALMTCRHGRQAGDAGPTGR